MAGRLQICKLTYRAVAVRSSHCSFPSSHWLHTCKKPNIGIHPWRWKNYRHVCTGSVEQNEFNVPQASNDDNGKLLRLKNLSVLQMKQERLGPLSIREVRKGIAFLKNKQETLSQEEILQLLQMTLTSVKNEYRDCADVVQELWQLCNNRKDARLTLQHLELYFQMCLLAEVPVGYETMLRLIDESSIEVSQELLEVMILILGRNGKVSDATNMLAFMKQHDMPITEVIFSALILAHGFNRDLVGVHDVLDAIRNVQLTFTNITYHAIMTAYVVSGNISSLNTVVMQMNRANIACTNNQLQSLLVDLVLNNEAGRYFENMDYILSLTSESRDVLDLYTVALRLITRGHLEEAIRLMSIYPPLKINNEFCNNARIHIEEMVQSVVDPALLIDMCHKLQQNEVNKFALLVALEIALKDDRKDLALPLLEAVKEDEKPLRQHYFWPLLASCSSVHSSELLQYVKKMVELGVPPDLETLKDYVFPGLAVKNVQFVECMLKDAGLTISQIATPLLVVLINRNMIHQAIDYVKTLKVQLSADMLTEALARIWEKSPHAAISLLALLIQKSNMNKTPEDVKEDLGGQFLLDIVASRSGLNKQKIISLLQELKKNEIKISEYAADMLIARTKESIRETLQRNINIVVGDNVGHPPKDKEISIMPHPRELKIDELEGHLIELQSKNFNTRGTLRRLIMLHAAENNSQRVFSLVKQLEENGDKLSPGILSSILGAYVSNKNAEAAIEIYLLLKELHPSFSMDSFKVIDFCAILIENGDSQVVFDILEESLVLEGCNHSKKSVVRNCKELLMAAAMTGDYEVTKRIYDLLRSRNAIDDSNLMLGALVKCRLNNGDLTGAVNEVQNIFAEFKLIPMKIEVLVNLLHKLVEIEKDGDMESDSLQKERKTTKKLLDAMSNMTAKMNGALIAHHDLMFACVEAGYPAKAKQILKKLGRNLHHKYLQKQCDRYVKTGREEPLLHLLTASSRISFVNRECIFKALLDIYCVQNNGDRGLSLWVKMQEEDIIPSKLFLITLESLLTSNSIKIPFKVDE